MTALNIPSPLNLGAPTDPPIPESEASQMTAGFAGVCLGAQGSWQVWGLGAGYGIPSSTALALPSEGTQNLEGTFVLTMLRTTWPTWASLWVLQASGQGDGGSPRRPE